MVGDVDPMISVGGTQILEKLNLGVELVQGLVRGRYFSPISEQRP